MAMADPGFLEGDSTMASRKRLPFDFSMSNPFFSKALLVFLFFFIPLVFAVREIPASSTNREYFSGFQVHDPIAANSGSYHFWIPLLDLGGVIPLSVALSYDLAGTGGGDTGFFHSFNTTLSFNSSLNWVIVNTENTGSVYVFTPSDGNWVLGSASRRYVLKETNYGTTTGYYYLLDPVTERVFIFTKFGNRNGRLIYILDRNGNRLTYDYTGNVNNPSSIFEGDGSNGKRRLRITETVIDGIRHLNSVTERVYENGTEKDGRSVSYQYGTCGGTGTQILCGVTDAAGGQTQFDRVFVDGVWVYGVTRQIRPLGNTLTIQEIARVTLSNNVWARVISQTDAYGNKTTFTYPAFGNKLTANRPDGQSVVYEHFGEFEAPKSLTDAAGLKSNFTQTANYQPATVTDRLGRQTTVTYHGPSGKIASVTNAKNQTITFTYTDQNQTFTNPANAETADFTFYNLTRIDYPDGTNEQFTHDTQGNVLTRIDRAGKTWAYTYDGKGQILTITNPLGGVMTNTFNADETLASATDSDGITVWYAYDLSKRLSRITHGDGTYLEILYNQNDQPTSIRDERGLNYGYSYDANGNLLTMTDPGNNQTTYAYDLMDRVNRITDRLGKQTTFNYNTMNLLQSMTDPNGLTTGLTYNTRGWRTGMSFGGQTWQTVYDDEGVPSSYIPPLGNAVTFQKNELGFIQTHKDALNQETTFGRDNLNRITSVTDPLNRTRTYTYNERNQITASTTPVIGTAILQWNDLGLLTRITDPNNKNWSFTYSPMGRLLSATDPLFRTTTFGYDNRNRLNTIQYPGGITRTLTYDAANNITQDQFPGGLIIPYTFDALDHLTSTTGIAFTYDAEDRVLSSDNGGTLFGVTYDNGGRVITASYNNNTFLVNYSYDPVTGLLSQVSDTLTNARVNFSYDQNRRLTGISRSNEVSTAYTWDGADRVIRLRDSSLPGPAIIDLQFSHNAAGEITGINQTVPLDPGGLLSQSNQNFTYDNASQLVTTGYAYDQRGRQITAPGSTFTWDGASRLTGINGISLGYNGLDDLVTRTEAGTTVHYYYNYALGFNPIVAEKNDTNGLFLRYYVYTPDGRLLYMIDPSAGNKIYYFHFDQIGSTLALTDSAGVVTDTYAYTPYGKLLQHTGSNPQPFTFVGQWGVRQEGSPSANSGLYQMRARYYDSHTGRFLIQDPSWPGFETQLFNPYSYAFNNPLLYVDIEGTFPVVNLAALFIHVPAPYYDIVIEGKLIDMANMEQRQRIVRANEIINKNADKAWAQARQEMLKQSEKYFQPTTTQKLAQAGKNALKGSNVAKGSLASLASYAYFRMMCKLLDYQPGQNALWKRVRERQERQKAQEQKDMEKRWREAQGREELARWKRQQAEVERVKRRGLNIWNVFPETSSYKIFQPKIEAGQVEEMENLFGFNEIIWKWLLLHYLQNNRDLMDVNSE